MKALRALLAGALLTMAMAVPVSAGCETWWTSCQPTLNQIYVPKAPVCARYVCFVA